MVLFRNVAALYIATLPLPGLAAPLPEWAEPRSFTLSDGLVYNLVFEKLKEAQCDFDGLQFSVIREGSDTAFLTQPALLECGDTHFEGVYISLPVVKDRKLTVYSYWNYWGFDGGYPVGAMKASFNIGEDGLHKTESYFYYEPGFQYGGRLLRQGPQDTGETERHAKLVSNLEEQFGAKFVVGEARALLFNETQTILNDAIKLKTTRWCVQENPQNREVAGAPIGLNPCANSK